MTHAHLATGEVVPLVPLIGDGILGLLTLGTFLVFIVCLGLQQGWDHTIGYGLRWLAGQIRGVTISVYFWSVHPLDFLADGLDWIDKAISHWLAVAALNTQSAAVAMWHLTAEVFWWSVHETKQLAVDTFHALEHAVTVTVPDAAKWARREAVDAARSLVHREAAIARAAERELSALAHTAEAEALYGVRSAEGALDWSQAETGALSRELGGLKARLEDIARAISPSAIVALIGATIFTDFGLGWLRCSSVGRLGRAVCGMPSQLLEDLLGLVADFFIFTHICQVVPLLETGFADIGAPLIGELTAAIDEMPCVKGYQASALSVPNLYLPANPGLTLHLP